MSGISGCDNEDPTVTHPDMDLNYMAVRSIFVCLNILWY